MYIATRSNRRGIMRMGKGQPILLASDGWKERQHKRERERERENRKNMIDVKKNLSKKQMTPRVHFLRKSGPERSQLELHQKHSKKTLITETK